MYLRWSKSIYAATKSLCRSSSNTGSGVRCCSSSPVLHPSILDRTATTPTLRRHACHMSTAAATAVVNSTHHDLTAAASRRRSQQYLYMWGTNQSGTILTPKQKEVPSQGDSGASTATVTTNATTAAAAAAAAAAAGTNQKYDVPTLMDTSLLLTNLEASPVDATTTTTTTTIDQVVCGPTETAILLSNGQCIVSGKNEHGQLGLSHTKPVVTPTLLNGAFDDMYDDNHESHNFPTKIRSVAFGTNFAAYLVEPPPSSSLSSSSSSTTTIKGYDLYTCGFGGSTLSGVGCLGHGTIDSVTQPQLVTSLYDDNVYVAQVVAGDAHCTILTTESEILTTGSGSYGRLGNFDTTDQLYFEPIELVLPSTESQIVQIAGGKSFTLALTNDGVIYGWGRNHKGQLGTGLGLAVDMYAMQSVPESISDTSDLLMNSAKIVKIAAGHSHAACLSESGEVFHWGMSLHLEPVLVDSLWHTKIVDIICGQDTTFAVDVHGHMYSFGNGNYTLGHGKETRQLNQAKKIPAFETGIFQGIDDSDATSNNKNIQRRIVHAAAGWKHVAVLLQEDELEEQ